MVIYEDYKNSRYAIKHMIENKQEMIDELKREITHLRKSMRILDTEFEEQIRKKETPPEYD
ncbi:MAG: hypothetical protein ACOCP8_04370 [archaeon]